MQIGGDVLEATGHSLGSEDVLIGGNLFEVNAGTSYFDGDNVTSGNIAIGTAGSGKILTEDINGVMNFTFVATDNDTTHMYHDTADNLYFVDAANYIFGLASSNENIRVSGWVYSDVLVLGYSGTSANISTNDNKEALTITSNDGDIYIDISEDADGQDGEVRIGDTGTAGEYAVIDSVGSATFPAGIIFAGYSHVASSRNTTTMDYYIGVSSDDGAITITLDTDTVTAGRTIHIKDEDGNATTNNITIDTEASETIDEANDITISTNFGAYSLYCDGTNWFIF